MIGNICIAQIKYYDTVKKTYGFKYRPILVLGGPRNNDYTVLPISSVSIQSHIDIDYDIKITPQTYPKLRLRKTCYIRTHKSTTVHKAEIIKTIVDMKLVEEDLYLTVLSKYEQWTKSIIDNAY